jgi:hypothetical protein
VSDFRQVHICCKHCQWVAACRTCVYWRRRRRACVLIVSRHRPDDDAPIAKHREQQSRVLAHTAMPFWHRERLRRGAPLHALGAAPVVLDAEARPAQRLGI